MKLLRVRASVGFSGEITISASDGDCDGFEFGVGWKLGDDVVAELQSSSEDWKRSFTNA